MGPILHPRVRSRVYIQVYLYTIPPGSREPENFLCKNYMTNKAQNIFEKLATVSLAKFLSGKKLFNAITPETIAQAEIFSSSSGQTIRDMRKRAPALARKLRKIYLDEIRQFAPGFGGVVFPGKNGKKVIGINYKLFKEQPKDMRKAILAHEYFHAKAPIFSRSELLAHLYGGLKSGTTKNELSRFIRTRPDRVVSEVIKPLVGMGLLGIAAILAKKYIK